MSSGNLLDFLRERAGDHLRGVARYTGNETDILYLREDIKEQRIQSQVDRMINRLRPESAPGEERAFPFGDLYVTVRRFEDAIIMHFPRGPDQGFIIALEPECAGDLNRFTSECLKRIDSD